MLSHIPLKTLLIATVSAWALGQSTHAQLTGQLGVLDLNASGGINPATGAAWEGGDTYRLIFASSTGRDATSSNIADYNVFIQNVADAAGFGSVDWKALASTSTVDARDNTNTNINVDGLGESFWLMDGATKIADNYTDFYDGHTNAEAINLSEIGGSPLDSGDFGSLWTGSDGSGQKKANAGGGIPGWLGTSPGVEGTSQSKGGLWCTCASAAQWIDRFNLENSGVRAFYGVSQVLTITDGSLAPGDTDGDGDIDDSDLGTSFANYTGPVGAAGSKNASQGDTDGDGDVDDSDLGTSFSGYTGPQGPAAVPEPASLALIGLGGLLVARRRRR